MLGRVKAERLVAVLSYSVFMARRNKNYDGCDYGDGFCAKKCALVSLSPHVHFFNYIHSLSDGFDCAPDLKPQFLQRPLAAAEEKPKLRPKMVPDVIFFVQAGRVPAAPRRSCQSQPASSAAFFGQLSKRSSSTKRSSQELWMEWTSKSKSKDAGEKSNTVQDAPSNS